MRSCARQEYGQKQRHVSSHNTTGARPSRQQQAAGERNVATTSNKIRSTWAAEHVPPPLVHGCMSLTPCRAQRQEQQPPQTSHSNTTQHCCNNTRHEQRSHSNTLQHCCHNTTTLSHSNTPQAAGRALSQRRCNSTTQHTTAHHCTTQHDTAQRNTVP